MTGSKIKKFVKKQKYFIRLIQIRQHTLVWQKSFCSTKMCQMCMRAMFWDDSVCMHIFYGESEMNWNLFADINWHNFTDDEEDAAKFIENKRPVFPVQYNKSNYDGVKDTYDGTPRECIDLISDSSDSEDEPAPMVINYIVFCQPFLQIDDVMHWFLLQYFNTKFRIKIVYWLSKIAMLYKMTNTPDHRIQMNLFVQLANLKEW